MPSIVNALPCPEFVVLVNFFMGPLFHSTSSQSSVSSSSAMDPALESRKVEANGRLHPDVLQRSLREIRHQTSEWQPF